MKAELMNQFQSELLSKRSDLVNKLCEQFARIEVPSVGTSVQPTSLNNNKSLFTICCVVIIACSIAFLAGLLSGKSALTAIGLVGAILAALAWLFGKKSASHQVGQSNNTPNLTIFCSKTNNAIRSIHSDISSEWDKFVSKQISSIKAQIVNAGVTEEKRNKVNDLLMTHSIITYQVMEIFPKLMSLAKTGDTDGISIYLRTIEDGYTKAIDSAVKEQVKCYEAISNIL